METDQELRKRLRYVVGDTRELGQAQGEQLDDLAWRHNLKRRHKTTNGFNYAMSRTAYQAAIDEIDNAIRQNLFADIPKAEFPPLCEFTDKTLALGYGGIKKYVKP